MTTDRDDREETQARLEWMKAEFEEARQRRVVKADARTVQLQLEADMKSAFARSAVHVSPLAQ